MKIIYAKEIQKTGHKVTFIVFALPFLYILYMGTIAISKHGSQPSVMILGIGMIVVSLIFAIALIRTAFQKLDLKITYDNSSFSFYLQEEPVTMNIVDIVEFTNYYYTVQNYKGHIGYLYLRIKDRNGSYIDIKESYYKHEDLIDFYKHCKLINPEIKDDFFKHFKFGMFTPEEGWYEYKKRMEKDNYKNKFKDKWY